MQALDALIELVRAVAASELMPRFRDASHARKADGSIVTAADFAVQAALVRGLPSIAPGALLGEEMTREEQEAAWSAGQGGLWVIDPLDGTTNFVQGLPAFAVSVAYLVGGRPRLGVVFNPAMDECFDAVAGSGARLNGEPLRCAGEAPRLEEAVAAAETKYMPKRLAAALATEPPFYSQRNWGSGALDWCYLAARRFDLYAHGGQKLWDYAAGALVLAESGGAASSFAHDAFWDGSPWSRPIVAVRDPALLSPWRAWVRSHLD